MTCLNEKEWEALMNMLNTPPTEKQRSMIRNAVKEGRKIKTHYG